MLYLRAKFSGWQTYGLVIFLLLLIPIQILTAAAQISPTFDESTQLGSGYAYLVTGHLRVGLDHPPLIKVLAALPLTIIKDEVPPNIDKWDQMDRFFIWPDQFVQPGIDDIDLLFMWARIPTALLTMLLGWVIYRWTADLFGAKAAVLPLLIFAFDPSILAHGGLVTTDVAAATFITFALYRLWRVVHYPTRRNVFWAGLAFGLAQLSKFSALILGPLILLLIFLAWLIPILSNRFAPNLLSLQYPKRSLSWYVGNVISIFIIGAIVIWIGYGFETVPVNSFTTVSNKVEDFCVSNHIPKSYCDLLLKLPLPAPSYFKGLRVQLNHARIGHAAFLAGQYSETGWWYYFPVAFLLKTPLPTMLLVGLGFLTSIRYYRFWPGNDLYLLLPAAAYSVSSMLTSINIGYRFLLPLLPLLFILTGRVGIRFRRRVWLVALIVVLCTWLIFESVNIHPNYLAYFNQLAGGPSNGYQWLADSNIDWGQDLRNLKTYMNQHGLERVKLSYFGSVSPAFYGIEYECLPTRPNSIHTRDGCPPQEGLTIEPGVYVISVTQLLGVYLLDHDTFAWFRNRQPTARIGYSLFVYDVEETELGHKLGTQQ